MESIIKNDDFKILLVDDEESVLTSTKSLLNLEGYNVITAKSGEEAIEIVNNQKIDILIIDYFMLGNTGEETIKEIRKTNKELVILLQTGYAGEKPPLQMLKELNIQGYHDKTDGGEKLLVWVAASVRVCNQMREIKSLYGEVNIARDLIDDLIKEK